MKSQLNYGNIIFEQDNDVDRIIHNAIQGKWTIVWDILDRKEYLINCIPSGRTWGVLHHAVYMGDEGAVRTLTSYPTCDPCIQTLRNPKFGPGETPEELTNNCDIIRILKGYIPKGEEEIQEVTEEDKGTVQHTHIGMNTSITSQMGNYGAGWVNKPEMNSFHFQNQNFGIYPNQTNYPAYVNSQTYQPNFPQMNYGYNQPNFPQMNYGYNQPNYGNNIHYGQMLQQSLNQEHVQLYETQPYNGPNFNQESPHTTDYENKWSHTHEYNPPVIPQSPVQVQSIASTHIPIKQKQSKEVVTIAKKKTDIYKHITTPNVSPTSTTPKWPCDAELISAMVYSAKLGSWGIVWQILDSKPHLINCIPSDRAWSALHQAAWRDNLDAVYKLLSYPACDPEIKTKLDKSNHSGIGKKPIDLAKCEKIKSMLRTAASKKQKINDEAPTMLPCCKLENYLGECIQMTLSCCRDVLVPKKWSLTHHNSIQSISIIMQTIFTYINTSNNWVVTRDNVSLTVQQFCNELGNTLWSRNELVVDSKEQFFKRVINLYTEETRVYSEMNRMLRLQDVSIQGHTTNGSDLSLGPYALLLNAILMYWNVLKKYTGKTYRHCALKKDQAEEYVKGQTFIWLSFSSSSKNQNLNHFACHEPGLTRYRFIMDNSLYSEKWSPREIAQYSEYSAEQECLYPFGAKFKVLDVHGRDLFIKLLDY